MQRPPTGHGVVDREQCGYVEYQHADVAGVAGGRDFAAGQVGHQLPFFARRIREPDVRAARDVGVGWNGEGGVRRADAAGNDVETGGHVVGMFAEQCDIGGDAWLGRHAVADHPVRIGGEGFSDLARGRIAAAAHADDAGRFDAFHDLLGTGIAPEGREVRALRYSLDGHGAGSRDCGSTSSMQSTGHGGKHSSHPVQCSSITACR